MGKHYCLSHLHLLVTIMHLLRFPEWKVVKSFHVDSREMLVLKCVCCFFPLNGISYKVVCGYGYKMNVFDISRLFSRIIFQDFLWNTLWCIVVMKIFFNTFHNISCLTKCVFLMWLLNYIKISWLLISLAECKCKWGHLFISSYLHPILYVLFG